MIERIERIFLDYEFDEVNFNPFNLFNRSAGTC